MTPARSRSTSISPPLRAIGYYEVVDGLLQRIPGPPDEASPESPVLLAALTAG
jgi:hypothetical protein